MEFPIQDDPMDAVAGLLTKVFPAVPILDIDSEEYRVCFSKNPVHTIHSEADLEKLARENDAVWCSDIKVLDEVMMRGVSFRYCKDAS